MNTTNVLQHPKILRFIFVENQWMFGPFAKTHPFTLPKTNSSHLKLQQHINNIFQPPFLQGRLMVVFGAG